MEDVFERQRALAKELKGLRKDKKAVVSQIKGLNKKRWELIDSIKNKNREATELKDERDKLNAEVKEIKKRRDEANEEVRKLVTKYKELGGASSGEDLKGLSKEMKRLEWKLQTSVLKIDKEDALVDKIKTLKKKLDPYEGLIKISEEIDSKKKASRIAHDKILAASEESQKKHDGFVEMIKGIRELEGKIEELNKKKEKLSKKLREIGDKEKVVEEKLIQVENEFRKVRGANDLRLDSKETKERAKDVYEEFKKGKKLDLEDIYLLRKSGLV